MADLPASSSSVSSSSSSSSASSSTSASASASTPSYPWLTPRPRTPWLLRPHIPLIKTRPGHAAYALVVAGFAAVFLAFRFLRSPRRFLSRVTEEEQGKAALRLNDPSLGQHLHLVANGIVIHAVSLGRDQDPLILFLHGFPEFWYSWRHQMQGLSRLGFRCVAIDMRGYGDSERPGNVADYDLGVLAADVEAVIKTLGHARAAAVVAHDWGAMVAYTFAARYPQSLERLVIANGPHPVLFRRCILTFPQVFRSFYVFFFQVPWLPEMLLSQAAFAPLRLVFKNHRGEPFLPREELDLYRCSLAKPGALTSAINYYRRMGRAPLRWIGKIAAPTLVVWGEDDTFLSPWANAGLEEVVEVLTFKTIPKCGHWIQAERGDEFNAAISEFLKA